MQAFGKTHHPLRYLQDCRYPQLSWSTRQAHIHCLGLSLHWHFFLKLSMSSGKFCHVDHQNKNCLTHDSFAMPIDVFDLEVTYINSWKKRLVELDFQRFTFLLVPTPNNAWQMGSHLAHAGIFSCLTILRLFRQIEMPWVNKNTAPFWDRNSFQHWAQASWKMLCDFRHTEDLCHCLRVSILDKMWRGFECEDVLLDDNHFVWLIWPWQTEASFHYRIHDGQTRNGQCSCQWSPAQGICSLEKDMKVCNLKSKNVFKNLPLRTLPKAVALSKEVWDFLVNDQNRPQVPPNQWPVDSWKLANRNET